MDLPGTGAGEGMLAANPGQHAPRAHRFNVLEPVRGAHKAGKARQMVEHHQVFYRLFKCRRHFNVLEPVRGAHKAGKARQMVEHHLGSRLLYHESPHAFPRFLIKAKILFARGLGRA